MMGPSYSGYSRLQSTAARGLQDVLLREPIIGWRSSEPAPKWITLVTNGADLIMS